MAQAPTALQLQTAFAALPAEEPELPKKAIPVSAALRSEIPALATLDRLLQEFLRAQPVGFSIPGSNRVRFTKLAEPCELQVPSNKSGMHQASVDWVPTVNANVLRFAVRFRTSVRGRNVRI